MHEPRESGLFDPVGAQVAVAELLRARFATAGIDPTRLPSAAAQGAGGHRSTQRGRGIEFDEVRAFQSGDDVRSIDWRVTARRGVLHTRLFHEERERPVFVLLEQSPATFFGSRKRFKSVALAGVAALLSWAAFERSDRVGGMIFGSTGMVEIRPGRARRHLLRWLGLVAEANERLIPGAAAQGSGVVAALTKLQHVAAPGSVVWLVCDLASVDDAAVSLLRSLSGRLQLVVVGVFDALERELPRPGRYAVSDGERTLQLDTRPAGARSRFREAFDTRLAHVRRSLAGCGVPLLALDAAEPLDAALQHFTQGATAPGGRRVGR